jgi:hypothetical protein
MVVPPVVFFLRIVRTPFFMGSKVVWEKMLSFGLNFKYILNYVIRKGLR